MRVKSELAKKVGTPRQAFQVIKAVTDEERWDRVRVARYEDLLVYLALSRFHAGQSSPTCPTCANDIKDFFGSYKARERGRRPGPVRDRRAGADRRGNPLRKGRQADALGALRAFERDPLLPTSLRVLEGCARELLGTVSTQRSSSSTATGRVSSYLEYPDFDTDPHPALKGAYMAALDSLRTDFVDYSDRDNPPILHRKERFVAADYELRERFVRLTKQEEKAGLFAAPERIGTAIGWSDALTDKGVRLRGHQLIRIKP